MLKIYRNSAHSERKSALKSSLIVAFYNNIEFFKLVWASIEIQSFKDFEVIIADDGSKPEVVQELQSLVSNSPIPCQHLWQEDIGFRKNRMLNWSILKSEGDCIVFIDGDCVLHPEFMAEHTQNQKAHTVLAGRRLDLSPGITKNLTAEKIKQSYLQKNLWWIIPSIALRKDNNGPKGIYLKNSSLRDFFNRSPRGIVGCNFSLSKADLLGVNGFDNRYEAPGTGEDSDLEFRLRLNGVEIRPFCHAAIQYHLWHRLQTRPSQNESLFREVQNLKMAKTAHGLSQLETP